MPEAVQSAEERVSLHDVLEEVPCPFCGEGRCAPVTGLLEDCESSLAPDDPFHGLRFQFVSCRRCELVYLRKRPPKEESGRFYSSAYHCFESFDQRGPIMSFLAQRVLLQKARLFERYFPASSRRLLDYGCGSGTWLKMLKRAGVPWELVGVDLMPDPIARLEGSGIQGIVGDETNIERLLPASSIGLVHLFHAIEHIHDPSLLLGKLHRLLVPGGAIIGQTPNVDCLERRVFGDYWNQWHVPRHLNLFSEGTLKAHAQRAGFEVVLLKSSLSGATQWAASLLKLWSLKSQRTYRSTREPLYGPLVLLSVPLAAAQIILGGRTSHMDFILRKPRED